MSSGYDPQKAQTYNKLRQQGLSEDAAATQAGIGASDFGNYALGANGQLGPVIAGGGKVAGVDYVLPTAAEQAESARFDQGLQSVDYDQKANSSPNTIKPLTYTTTSTETVSGGGSTTIIAGPRQTTAQSQALSSAYDAKQAEYNQFIKDNPSDFARKKQGLPPMTADEKAAYQQRLSTLNQEKETLKNQQIAAETAGPPTVVTTPNTTTTTTTTTTSTSINAPEPLNQQNDQAQFNQVETQIGSTLPTPTASTAAPVNPEVDAANELAAQQAEGRAILAPTPVNPITEPQQQAFLEANAEPQGDAINGLDLPPPVNSKTDPQLQAFLDANAEPQGPRTRELDVESAASENATKQLAKNQATLQSRYKQPGSSDWRVRVQLAPTSDYLYNASPPGILAPLVATNGVVFPYTPQISTSYRANYEQYDLIHSNFRGLFYKNSRVDDVQIRGTFTAQDTTEANYVLAVIHFFRSVTKMFYGQDPERGTPPPLVYLSGFGQYQFYGHPCVVTNFSLTLPNNVDYVRAINPNNYGSNLLNRRAPVKTNPANPQLAGAVRLLNALLPKGAEPSTPAPGTVPANVANLELATYVPTTMEIEISLIPVQSRSQVSKQFSLKKFANGDLIKGGYW